MESAQTKTNSMIKVNYKKNKDNKAKRKKLIIVFKSVMPNRYSADKRKKLKEFEQNWVIRQNP